MKTFRQFAAEAYVKNGYLPESYDQLDENPVMTGLTKVGTELSKIGGRWTFGGGKPGEIGYDAALKKRNQNKFRDGEKGNQPNEIAKTASGVATSLIPWEKIPGAVWKKGIEPTLKVGWELTKAALLRDRFK